MLTKTKTLLMTLALTTVGVTATAVHADQNAVQDIIKQAVPVARANNLYPSVAIAQALLESSYGESGLAQNYHNLFGVKWTYGQSVTLMTKEVENGVWIDTPQAFQVYPTYADSFTGYAKLIRNNPLYAGVWRENAPTYMDATANLQGRYATDDSYASKLNAIISQNNLTQYDTIEPPKTETKAPQPEEHVANETKKLFSGLQQALKAADKIKLDSNIDFDQLNLGK